MIKVTAWLEYKPTEDPGKLKEIICKFLGIKESEISESNKNDRIYFEGSKVGISSIKFFYDVIRKQQIVQSARKFIFSRWSEEFDSVIFMINKQAAYMGKIHFCDEPSESPLGPLYLKIESDKMEKLLEYLVPQTKNGMVLEVNYLPE